MTKAISPEAIAKGLVHVYTGDGKGKTTAALGLALRALGWGGRVVMIQFIKGYADIGEARFASGTNGQFELVQFAVDETRFIGEDDLPARKEAAAQAMDSAKAAVTGGNFDVVILDEVNNAVHYKLVDVEEVLSLIAAKPAHVELVLTGRCAPQSIVDAADYVTEMRHVKHPYENGVQARRCIDY